jgi:hypothetical protein
MPCFLFYKSKIHNKIKVVSLKIRIINLKSKGNEKMDLYRMRLCS